MKSYLLQILISIFLVNSNLCLLDFLEEESLDKRFRDLVDRIGDRINTVGDYIFRRNIFMQRIRNIEDENERYEGITFNSNKFSILSESERRNYLGIGLQRERIISIDDFISNLNPINGFQTIRDILLNRRPVGGQLIDSISEDIDEMSNLTRRIFYRYRDLIVKILNKDEDSPTDSSSLFGILNSRGLTDIDWERDNKVTTVKDQGECGSCWAFAAVSAVESIYLIENGQSAPADSLDLAEQELVDDCESRMDCSGGWNDYALDYIKENGINLEVDYPYTA